MLSVPKIISQKISSICSQINYFTSSVSSTVPSFLAFSPPSIQFCKYVSILFSSLWLKKCEVHYAMAVLSKTRYYKEKYSALPMGHHRVYTEEKLQLSISELGPYIHRESVTDPEKNVYILLGVGAKGGRALVNLKVT